MDITLTLPMLAQGIISGVLAGAVYAVAALGLTMIFGVLRIVNVSHGELLMLGAYTSYWLFKWLGLDPLLSLAVSFPLMFLLGTFIQRYIMSRVLANIETVSLIVTFGISIFLVNLAIYLWTTDYRSIRYLSGAINVGGLSLSIPRLVAFGVAVLITVAAFVFLKKTRTGKAIRATAQSRDMAMACGVNIRQIHLITFGIGAGLAAASGSLMTLMYAIYPEMGIDYTMKSFIIIILGGMGSYVGALVGALILGLVEALGSLVFSMEAGAALTFVLLLVVLVAMPAGLAGWRRTS